MKRWLLFGNVYMKNAFSVNFLFMILLPIILPTMLLFLSFYLGINYLLTVFYLFISKVVLFYVIRLSIYRVKREEKEKKSEKMVFMTLLFQITQLLYELISEFILPFMLLYTLLTPPVIIWRNKKIRVKDGKIHYEL